MVRRSDRPSPLPAEVREAVADFRDRLAARFGDRLEDVRLFGSWARSEGAPDSDVDVLVVVAGLTHAERGVVCSLACDVHDAHRVDVAPLALSARRWAHLQRRELLIAQDIARDGIPA